MRVNSHPRLTPGLNTSAFGKVSAVDMFVSVSRALLIPDGCTHLN